MPRGYVLDESVIKGALEEAGSCRDAIVRIVRRCDSLAYNEQWHQKCYVPVQRSAYSTVGYALLQVLKHSFAWRGKMCQVVREPPALADEGDIHHKDLWLVRLAVASGACLVTEDAKLADVLRRKHIPCSDSRAVVEG